MLRSDAEPSDQLLSPPGPGHVPLVKEMRYGTHGGCMFCAAEVFSLIADYNTLHSDTSCSSTETLRHRFGKGN